MFLPVNDKQFEFWRLRRSGLPNINIARSFDVVKLSGVLASVIGSSLANEHAKEKTISY